MRKKNNINHYSYYVTKKNFSPIIEYRFRFILIILFILMSVLIVDLYYVQVIKNKYYKQEVMTLGKKIVFGESSPRGRFYDRNGKILVDNKAVKVIYYKKDLDVSLKKEIELAYKASKIIDTDYQKLSDYNLRYFYYLNHMDECRTFISNEEYKMLKERKINSDDILNFMLKRIPSYNLSLLTDDDNKAAYMYYLMNKGYSYVKKTIDNDVTDEEYAKVAGNLTELPGFSVELAWERYYPYNDYFRSILGNVSKSETGIPVEDKEYYLNIGYSLTDRVGISYLEKQYESVLKGTKPIYEIGSDGEYKLISEGARGNDVVLSIDIELQKAIEDILNEELLLAKQEPNTEYFDSTFVVVSNPNTGEVLAMAGKQIKNVDGEYKIFDYTPGVIQASVTPGSSVKGASHIVGYKTGALSIGEVRDDACIKIAATPMKCSFHTYGLIDDLEALKYSSNTYQYQTAIRVGKGNYQYNAPLIIDQGAFDTYRDMFATFGLGVKTGIDLPNETTGYKGKQKLSGLLLDYSIGQYDNYTPIELNQYINTIANGGYRLEPHLLKAVYSSSSDSLTNLIYENEATVLNKIDIDDIYMNRVREGFKMVFEWGGTGSGIIDHNYNPAGKTGTAESFLDTDGDGIVDRETISSIVLAYAPYDNPVVSFTVISPNLAPIEVGYDGMTRVNTRITQKVSQKYFEIYK